MKIIKNLFLIIMLFIFNACDSDSSTGPSSTCGGDGSSCLIDLLLGTWTITGQCIAGELYSEFNGCEAYNECEEFNDGTYAVINGYNYTFCDGGTDCQTTSFTLNGNTISISDPYDPGQTISQSIILSNNNLTAEIQLTINYNGCWATFTETWQKNQTVTPPSNSGGCYNIAGEWDGVNQVTEITGCSGAANYDEDISNINWGLQSNGTVEMNYTNSFTEEEYYQCISDTEIQICEDNDFTGVCEMLIVTVVPNSSLSLWMSSTNSDGCQTTTTFNFVPED